MGAPTSGRVDLQTAADELGVHYQTAYRWVRNGRLDAELVGGRYLVSPTDIVELDRARHTPAAPTPPRPSRLEHATHRMYRALVAGDEPAATRIIRRLAEEGAPTIELLRVVLIPPLEQIGRAWHDGELTVGVEHRASAIVERLLGGLAPNPRGRRRGVVVVAALTGDRHALPTTMAAVALRADNWHVHHLGADLPPDEITRFCESSVVDVAVITVTNPETRATADATATRLRVAGTPAIVGGPGKDLIELIDLTRSAAARRPVETRRNNTTK
jgi:excisionase family DNA binding protein